MAVTVTGRAIDPMRYLQDWQATLSKGASGAQCHFLGSMRDTNLGDLVSGMHMECYPAMAERMFAQLERDALKRYELESVLLLHRYGALEPGDAIVLVAVAARHREAAFAACRHLIEALKHEAPFWKREQTAEGRARWVAPA